MFNTSLIDIGEYFLVFLALSSLTDIMIYIIRKYFVKHNNGVRSNILSSKIMYCFDELKNKPTVDDKNNAKKAKTELIYPRTNIKIITEFVTVTLTVAVGSITQYIKLSSIHDIWLIALAWNLYVIALIWKKYDFNQENYRNKTKMMPQIKSTISAFFY